MKVGILTFHHTPNYGAALQAYALWVTIKNQGHDVEIIDYRPEQIEKFYWGGMSPIKIRPFRKGLRFDVDSLRRLLKYFKFRAFLSKKILLSKKSFRKINDLRNFKHRYDLVICGSDQIWCLDSSFRNFDPSFFLDFIDRKDDCKKISYAASFGSTEDLGSHREVVCKLLNDFDAISVRDTNSLDIVQEGCNQQASLVLDPTFLASYGQLISSPQRDREYLLIYSHGSFTLQEESLIKGIAQQLNLEIVSVGYYNRVAQENCLTAGPEEWLGYFSKASYVITNTFHGTIFSLIFRRRFAVLPCQGKMQKISDLLRRIDLCDQVVNMTSAQSVSDLVEIHSTKQINYALVGDKIENEVQISKDYLFSQLGDL
jgi:polysaccharide pyruvyl transferase WcaK-like protein